VGRKIASAALWRVGRDPGSPGALARAAVAPY